MLIVAAPALMLEADAHRKPRPATVPLRAPCQVGVSRVRSAVHRHDGSRRAGASKLRAARRSAPNIPRWGLWPTTYCAAGDQSMCKWPQSWYRSAHDTRQHAESRWGGMASMSRADQTMDTPGDVDVHPRAPSRSTSSTSRLAAAAKDYPPGCGSGQWPCAIPELTQLVLGRVARYLI